MELQTCSVQLYQKGLQHRRFLAIFVKFLRIRFFIEHLRTNAAVLSLMLFTVPPPPFVWFSCLTCQKWCHTYFLTKYFLGFICELRTRVGPIFQPLYLITEEKMSQKKRSECESSKPPTKFPLRIYYKSFRKIPPLFIWHTLRQGLKGSVIKVVQ